MYLGFMLNKYYMVILTSSSLGILNILKYILSPENIQVAV